MKRVFIVLLTLIFVFVGCLSLNYALVQVRFSASDARYRRVNIVIDAGHGGRDSGTSAPDQTREKDINLAIALNLYDMAMISGISAFLTRDGDYLLYAENDNRNRSDLYNRYDYINTVANSVLVSIHQNFYSETSQWGMQIWYSQNDTKSKVLADSILHFNKKYLQPENERQNKASDDSYYLLYHAKVPSVMVECGFMSNSTENELLKTEEYRQKLSYCILLGVNEYIVNEVD